MTEEPTPIAQNGKISIRTLFSVFPQVNNLTHDPYILGVQRYAQKGGRYDIATLLISMFLFGLLNVKWTIFPSGKSKC